jgi:creatinine amidohydrolase
MGLSENGGSLQTASIEDLTSKEFSREIRRNPLVILPVGALEEHGPHLPLSADIVQPLKLARAIAAKRRALILPPFWYGYCSSTRNFPGTVSIEVDTLRLVARDLVADIYRNGVRKLLVLSGHAGLSHMAALREGALEVAKRHSDYRIVVMSDYDFAYEMLGKDGIPATDGHAGFVETSRVLSAAPRLVKGHTRVKPDAPTYHRMQIVGRAQDHWKSGVHGDPRGASAAAGRRVDAHVLKRTLEMLDEVFFKSGPRDRQGS